MRAILNGKPGWRYALVLVVVALPLGLVLHYSIEVYVNAHGFTGGDVLATVLHALGYATVYTLLRRAVYRRLAQTHSPAPDTEPPAAS